MTVNIKSLYLLLLNAVPAILCARLVAELIGLEASAINTGSCCGPEKYPFIL